MELLRVLVQVVAINDGSFGGDNPGRNWHFDCYGLDDGSQAFKPGGLELDGGNNFLGGARENARRANSDSPTIQPFRPSRYGTGPVGRSESRYGVMRVIPLKYRG